jgi:transposase
MEKTRVVFKRSDQKQPMLLPPSFADPVPEKHPVRVVDGVVERIVISALAARRTTNGYRQTHRLH